jgi:hypothetical protein
MKHICHSKITQNDLYYLVEIELLDAQWILHNNHFPLID